MAWYAYCLTEHQALPNGTRARRPFLLEGIQGVNGAPVLSYPSGEFAVVVSEYDRATHTVDASGTGPFCRFASGLFLIVMTLCARPFAPIVAPSA